ncbi:MAG: hypothetical protein KAX31_01930, partial [Thermoplasmata archaeon]|nr:hypothetical protein [Thermoplasmata archaeon]
MNVLNVTFINFDDDAVPPDAFNIDLIQLNVTLEYQYPTYPTMITVDNSEMTVINSFVSVDWLNFGDVEEFPFHNAFDLSNGANLYLYNVSMETDDNSNGIEDFLEVPPGDPAPYMPYRTETLCQVYNYKWLEVPVMDRYYAPVEGANITSEYFWPNATFKTLTEGLNDLSDGAGDELAAETRILDYLDRTQARIVDTTNYNKTCADGVAYIPLLEAIINETSYPNNDHVGDYRVDVNYTRLSINYSGSTNCDFIPFPNVQPEENVVVTDTVQLNTLRLPRGQDAPGLIVNGTQHVIIPKLTGTYSILDYIIVEENGFLEILTDELEMTYSNSGIFEIIVRDGGNLTMNGVSLRTLNNHDLLITIEDNAELCLVDTTSTLYVDYLAKDQAEIFMSGA